MPRLTRRLVTIPLYFALFALAVVSLPVALVAAIASDLARGVRFAVTRALLFFTWYLGCECVGLLHAFGLWLWRLAAHPEPARWLAANVRLKARWAGWLWRGAEIFFGLRAEIEGDREAARGPVLVLMRHASTADTILTSTFLTLRHGTDFRHVIKRELLWDPCLDVAGHRLPNYFVDRDSDDSAAEIRAVARLAEDLGPGDGVLIYPEGTRFTPAKRARILEKLTASGDRELAHRASSLVNVLPPRLGGTLGLLDAAPGVDVVFCAHVGFDGIQSFNQFLAGGLVNRTVRIAYWRVPAANIPADRDARIDWLFDHWARIDAWIAEHGTKDP